MIITIEIVSIKTFISWTPGEQTRGYQTSDSLQNRTFSPKTKYCQPKKDGGVHNPVVTIATMHWKMFVLKQIQ